MAETGKWDSCQIKYYKSVAKIKKQLSKGSWTYLCNHPEIRAIIRVLIHQAINIKPQNILQFTAEFFNCSNTPLLVNMINEQLKRVKDQLKRGRWSQFDGEMFFTDNTESTHSLLSNASTEVNVNPILSFALILNKDDECNS